MSLRQRISRVRNAASAPSRDPLPGGMAECTICGVRADLDEYGALPDYWFTLATCDEVRCPDCLAPVLAKVDREWADSTARFLARYPDRGGR